ncbi:uncharacterized protein PHALS_06550 [Plasmopara halstedii]|uniref:Uncharacterized protein n=1 Tax=Plasmopara halstedii TaxID=4781 RepID=A0A0P1B207_PLAHL|nr:uncharacterized protein PHALS_06550 [Plasmopara halstedii]CEG48744.1 hypothetical protein PHALS_06550 [Plasmopara halstedii]|eukprot:XP_024585113.1 hypothetical protein PHALS_06550 [Plasmopara halstedii]
MRTYTIAYLSGRLLYKFLSFDTNKDASHDVCLELNEDTRDALLVETARGAIFRHIVSLSSAGK